MLRLYDDEGSAAITAAWHSYTGILDCFSRRYNIDGLPRTSNPNGSHQSIHCVHTKLLCNM